MLCVHFIWMFLQHRNRVEAEHWESLEHVSFELIGECRFVFSIWHALYVDKRIYLTGHILKMRISFIFYGPSHFRCVDTTFSQTDITVVLLIFMGRLQILYILGCAKMHCKNSTLIFILFCLVLQRHFLYTVDSWYTLITSESLFFE